MGPPPTRPPFLAKNRNIGCRRVFMHHLLNLEESIKLKLQAEKIYIIPDL